MVVATTVAGDGKLAENTSASILKWFKRHGRHDLPWQQDINAYRVWISEIMLQQTQVNTVIPYYQRFMASFPNVEALANADLDDVLHHWTGLGYYARARNLHQAAAIIANDYNGELPQTVDELQQLPGIGRSTAGAISSIAFKQRAAILDGNVKRVLSRLHCVEGWYGKTAVQKELWLLAERYTPATGVNQYTQAIMDLGATLCTRSKPACERCPIAQYCAAHISGRTTEFPHKKPRKVLPVKSVQMLLIENPDGAILLEKRPAQGIWGGLWSFPEAASDESALALCAVRGIKVSQHENRAALRHTFSHYHLDIQPVHLQCESHTQSMMEADRQLWYNRQDPPSIGLAAPVKKLLSTLHD